MTLHGTYDDALGVHALFINLPRRHAIYVKVLLESYEGVAVVRSVEPHYAPGRILQVIMIVPDQAPTVQGILSSIETDTDMERVDPSESLLSELRQDLLVELKDA